MLGKIELQIKSHCAHSYNFGSTAAEEQISWNLHIWSRQKAAGTAAVFSLVCPLPTTLSSSRVWKQQSCAAGPQQSLSILAEASAPCPSAHTAVEEAVKFPSPLHFCSTVTTIAVSISACLTLTLTLLLAWILTKNAGTGAQHFSHFQIVIC